MADRSLDVLILSNGPGEVTTWVRPVVRALRARLGDDHDRLRISVILSPCSNGTGREAAIAAAYPEVDRVQGAEAFWPFLLWGRTAAGWDWRDRGVTIFLGGDQFFALVAGKRLGYKILTYAEWEVRWLRWIDRAVVTGKHVLENAPEVFRPRCEVVGDLMVDGGEGEGAAPVLAPGGPLVGLLPGSKRAKLMQGVPLMLATADRLRGARPDLRFAIPVAPTLTLAELARYGQGDHNPAIALVDGTTATLVDGQDRDGGGDRADSLEHLPYLETPAGTRVFLWPHQPAAPFYRACALCLTTVGANTAELGALAVPAIVLLPIQQLDAMRAWDGIPGLLANLPGVGGLFAKVINTLALRRLGLLAWPNLWAGEMVMPELVGRLTPEAIAAAALDLLDHPEQLRAMGDRLRQVCGPSGAAARIAAIVEELAESAS
ncbi:MAG: lipid-A-disaccharide synthase [Cyanobacteria bacterium]|nr:lipid-A-disaccharide synthase [Cyanobacteriota bacterium]